LRVSEKLVLGFFVYAVLASVAFPLSWRERVAVLGLNLAATAVILLLGRFSRPSEFLAVLRDWFPCILILLAYRESGLFFIPDPSHRLDYLFVRWDARLLRNPLVLAALSGGSPWLQRYLEFSYFLAYPLVPLGLGSLYLARRHGALGRSDKPEEGSGTIDHFWTAVLLALFSCYMLFPLFPSTPPRSFFHDSAGPVVRPLFRKMNFWILGQYGIQSSVFPSGHVAAVTATALSVRSYQRGLGVVFLIAALSVATATVYGRYHYAADALAGAAIGFTAFLVASRILKR
jgi:membrane-associated phospholipid phosphatase